MGRHRNAFKSGARTHDGGSRLGVDDRSLTAMHHHSQQRPGEGHAFVWLGIVHEGDGRTAGDPQQHPHRNRMERRDPWEHDQVSRPTPAPCEDPAERVPPPQPKPHLPITPRHGRPFALEQRRRVQRLPRLDHDLMPEALERLDRAQPMLRDTAAMRRYGADVGDAHVGEASSGQPPRL